MSPSSNGETRVVRCWTLVFLPISQENSERKGSLCGSSHRDIKGKTCWIIFLMICRSTRLAAAPRRRHFSASWGLKEFSPVAMATTTPYPSQNLCAPAGLSAHRGLADLLLARGKLQLPATLFQPRQGLLWSNEALRPAEDSVLLPVNLRALSPAQGAVTGQGRGGRASRWCVSTRLRRGNAHIWCGLYLLLGLLLDECGFSSSSSSSIPTPEMYDLFAISAAQIETGLGIGAQVDH